MLQNRKKDPYSLAESLLNEVFIWYIQNFSIMWKQ
jgi:hypothetical protein